MKLASTAFADGAEVPRRFTFDGENISPPLIWTGAPEGTKSFALVCDDPDADWIWHHWAVYDIPAAFSGLPEDIRMSGPKGFPQGVNDFHRMGYGGPCPPRGDRPHHYEFSLLALDVERLDLGEDPTCVEIEREARRHAIAEARLTGLYARH